MFNDEPRVPEALLSLDNVVLQPHVGSGKLRALAIAGPGRLSQLSETPTMAESGYPSAVRPFWFSMFGLTGTPEPVLQKINVDLVKIAASSEVQTALRSGGYQTPTAMSIAQMDALVRGDTEAWGPSSARRASRPSNAVLLRKALNSSLQATGQRRERGGSGAQ